MLIFIAMVVIGVITLKNGLENKGSRSCFFGSFLAMAGMVGL